VTGGGELALFGGKPAIPSHSHQLWPIVTDDERTAVARVLDRGVLSGPFAPESMALEEEFARFVGAKHCILTHCGTSALLVALSGAGVRAGDEVIVPAYSFVATPLAVAQIGAIPVFADIDEASGCIDPALAEAAVTERTRAIMPVHMHGCAADMTRLLEVATRRGLVVVEDAAQAHGATSNGKPVGALGAAGGFSLQSSKNLGAGEGGLMVTNDAAVAEAASAVRNFGQDLARSEAHEFDPTHPLDGIRALDSQRMGSMFRGNEMMAAFARAQLARLPERTERCQRNAERLARALSDLPGVTPPSLPAGRTSVHHKFRVRLDPERAELPLSATQLRDAMLRALRAEGLEVVLWQSAPLPAQGVFQRRDERDAFPRQAPNGTDLGANYDPARYPRTKALLAGSLLLFSQSYPLIAQSEETVDRYAEAFRKVWRQRDRLVDAAAARRP
jgi:dTDP-4-amino-4,6-dideoxygalactose transaminase